MQLKSGALLQGGKYRIEKVLGQGGFGITYLAVQVSLERYVAVKEFFMKDFCNRDDSTSSVTAGSLGSRDVVSRYREKFIKEARSIAKLNHPNIVKVIDVFEENGTAYYVMEYLSGDSLSTLVRRQGRLSQNESLKYICQIASALEYIHGEKMLHLDVKPANVLLNEKKDVVLIDFGMVKHYDAEGNQTSTTPVGVSAGYAPFEQYSMSGGGLLTPATDIYALGATLYKLLTGVTPPDASALIADPELMEYPSYMSAGCAAVIHAAMNPVARKRPQTISEFKVLLDSSASSAASDGDEKTVLEREDDTTVVFPDGRKEYNGSRKISIWRTRSWIVNVILLCSLALVAGVGIGTFVMSEGDVVACILTLLTSAGVGGGLMVLLKNKSWGYGLMLLSTSVGCLLLDWTVWCFDIGYINFVYYISISIVVGLILFVRKNGCRAWSQLEKVNLRGYKYIQIAIMLLLAATLVSQIIYPVSLSSRESGRKWVRYDDLIEIYEANQDASRYFRAR